MIHVIRQEIVGLLDAAGVSGEIELSTPPKPEMGHFAYACFGIAKQHGQNPAEVAKKIAASVEIGGFVERVEAFGPYVNFFLDMKEVANATLKEISENSSYGSHSIGKGKKYVIEYACPNPLKAFHMGHLKNLITGEAVVRTFENAGYDVVRVNYQGDVGMHIAKALWGIYDLQETFEKMRSEDDIKKRVEFLGEAYAHGSQHFESSEESKEQVIEYNDKVYEGDKEIQDVYQTARQWSLDYFDLIYRKLGTRFDKLYFESEMFEQGTEMAKDALQKGILAEGEGGAIIFEGSKHGLHDRVFINSKGFPTYEAKELALAQKHFSDHNPDLVIHVVGKEQTEYFKVVFKALEEILPQTKDKEFHLIGGFLQLKGSEKMSSRTGRIVTGDALMFLVEERVQEIMAENDLSNKDEIVQKVSIAALKYAMLKADVSKDVAFDMEESVSISGDSGPYLLYIVARIESLLLKIGGHDESQDLIVPEQLDQSESALLLLLAKYPMVTKEAVEEYDPSRISKYLFELAQGFNTFYANCPIIQDNLELQTFRVQMSKSVMMIMKSGLHILGIDPVKKM